MPFTLKSFTTSPIYQWTDFTDFITIVFLFYLLSRSIFTSTLGHLIKWIKSGVNSGVISAVNSGFKNGVNSGVIFFIK